LDEAKLARHVAARERTRLDRRAGLPVAGGGAALTGRDLSDIRFHRVLGMVKLAVILLQLHALHRRGATVGPRYIAFGSLAVGLLAFAQEVRAERVF